MEFNQRKLSLIHIEAATALLPRINEPGVTARLIATYFTTPGQLKEARTSPAALEPMVGEAEAMDALEAQKVVADFFGQWRTYHANTMSSMEAEVAEAEAVVRVVNPQAIPE